MSWMISWMLDRCNFFQFELLQLNSDTSEISNSCSRINTWVPSINLYTVDFYPIFRIKCRFSKQIFVRKMAACKDEVMNFLFSNKRILFYSFHLFVWRLIQKSLQSLIHFFFEWDWTDTKNIVFFFRLQATVSISSFDSRSKMVPYKLWVLQFDSFFVSWSISLCPSIWSPDVSLESSSLRHA